MARHAPVQGLQLTGSVGRAVEEAPPLAQWRLETLAVTRDIAVRQCGRRAGGGVRMGFRGGLCQAFQPLGVQLRRHRSAAIGECTSTTTSMLQLTMGLPAA